MAASPQKIHAIIHEAALASAASGVSFAQVPGADEAVILPIQAAMVMAIAREHGASVTEGVVAKFLLPYASLTVGRVVVEWVVGWLPGAGNAVNAATAATLTETIGWAADKYFGSFVRA